MQVAEHTLKTLRGVVPLKDLRGEPVFVAGGNSAVFRILIDGKDHAIKCYFTPQPNIQKRIECFTRYGDELIENDVRFLPEELWVWNDARSGMWCDIAIKQWKEGNTLRFETRKALNSGDTERIAELAKIFDDIAIRLLSKEWAHGDMKPENIVINGNDIVLIDYGACYMPSFGDYLSPELGTPAYQHPRRTEEYFNRHIDDYAIAIISATLHTLSYEPLYKQFSDDDALLFNSIDIWTGNSKTIEPAKKVAREKGDKALLKLIEALHTPNPHIEGLAEILHSFN